MEPEDHWEVYVDFCSIMYMDSVSARGFTKAEIDYDWLNSSTRPYAKEAVKLISQNDVDIWYEEDVFPGLDVKSVTITDVTDGKNEESAVFSITLEWNVRWGTVMKAIFDMMPDDYSLSSTATRVQGESAQLDVVFYRPSR